MPQTTNPFRDWLCKIKQLQITHLFYSRRITFFYTSIWQMWKLGNNTDEYFHNCSMCSYSYTYGNRLLKRTVRDRKYDFRIHCTICGTCTTVIKCAIYPIAALATCACILGFSLWQVNVSDVAQGKITKGLFLTGSGRNEYWWKWW